VLKLVERDVTLGPILGTMLEELAACERRATEIKRVLRAMAHSETDRSQVRLLQSAPGIGWLTAIRLCLEWGDLSAFRNAAAFVSYLGLTPSEHRSGDLVRRGHITRQGNAWVRTWLVEAAWKAITIDPALGRRFRRLAPRPADRKRAIVAIARSLALRLRACCLTGQVYVTGVVA